MEIIKIKTCDDKFVLLNLEELKVKDSLEGAYVFKTLLGINEKSPFKITNDKDRENLFDKLNISSTDWYLTMSFLNNGFPPYYIHFKQDKENEALLNLLIETIENLNRVNITLGGIPSFDHFYVNFYKEDLKIIEKYNPVNPGEDYKQEFEWRLDDSECYNSTSIRNDFHSNLDKNFQCVSTFRSSNTSPYTLKWYRKLK